MMPLSATFDYVAVVPQDPKALVQPWAARLGPRANRDGDASSDAWLVGSAPALQITDAGQTPNPGWHRGRWLPGVQRAQITLSAADRRGATVASAAFYIDRVLINCFRPGDTVHLVRTRSGGLAISVIRDETLVTAVGAVAAVPLGKDLGARYPGDLIHAVKELFREAAGVTETGHGRDVGHRSAATLLEVLKDNGPIVTFELPLPEVPLEIGSGDQRYFLCRGQLDLGPYRIFMVRGFLPGIPGADACAAISRAGACSETAASSSAQLLEDGEISVLEW